MPPHVWLVALLRWFVMVGSLLPVAITCLWAMDSLVKFVIYTLTHGSKPPWLYRYLRNLVVYIQLRLNDVSSWLLKQEHYIALTHDYHTACMVTVRCW